MAVLSKDHAWTTSYGAHMYTAEILLLACGLGNYEA